MRKNLFFLFILCFVLALSPFRYAEPFWLKEGVYFKYTADKMFIVQKSVKNTTYVNYYGEYAEFYWEVLEIKNRTARILITLNISNITFTTTHYMTEKEAKKKFKKLVIQVLSLKPNLKHENCAIYNIDPCQVRICNDTVLGFIKSCDNMTYYLVISPEKRGIYEYVNTTLHGLHKSAIIDVDLESNIVKYNGSKIGPNLLFINPSMVLTGLGVLETSNNRIFISNITIANFIVHTYYMDFKPPIIIVATNTHEYLWYDSSTGILISGGIPPNIARNVFGFDTILLSNRIESKNLKKGFNSKDYYGIGMILEDTNVDFSGVMPLSGVSISKLYLGLFVVSLSSLVFSIIFKSRRG
ncbi:hypothetical protein K1720_04180 [Thermococcus argininiproducens]|uniref:Uncharacterized protein n=1 Tax=Thermococcus argininiproducens TaxID=2866384 RepID=A0A9E7MB05_9EURY|nr:hypothetical protein [Thermococcus argininiproducens]USH00645.1 hypothetical protein K1720_04180 [Thermococcus argininiproducens]